MASSKPPESTSGTPPSDLVVMGRITGPFGVKGWLKIQVFTELPENLLAYPRWWIGQGASWQEERIEQGEVHTGSIVAKLAGCDDRDAAARFRGREIAVSRGAFPTAADDEFYWADLIGLKVVNEQGVHLGAVSRIFETGANDVLVVEGERQRLLPFTEQVVKHVDRAQGIIHVDWAADY